MKKIFSILLVTLLAVSTVFADFSGSAKLSYTYDFDSKDTGFANATNGVVDFDYATLSAENIGEGDVYAQVKGSLSLKAYNGADGFDADVARTGYLFMDMDISASINGTDWSVGILEVPSRLDLAVSSIDYSTVSDEDDDYGFDKDDYDDYKTYAVPFQKAPGFSVTYKGYTVGFGLNYKNSDSSELFDSDDASITAKKHYKGLDISAVAKTPEIEIIDGLNIQAGISYYQNETAGVKWVTDKKIEGPDSKKLGTNRGQAAGGSLALGYEYDAFAIKVATDLGYTIAAYDALNAGPVKNDEKSGVFNMDVAGTVSYDFIKGEAYANLVDRLISGRITTNLASFNVPLSLSVYGKNVYRPAREFGADIEVTPIEGLKVTVGGGYVMDADDIVAENQGQWKAKAGAEYAMDIVTVSGNVSLKNAAVASDIAADKKIGDVIVGLNLKAVTTIVPGAEISLEYAADDLAQIYNAGKVTADELDPLGTITAACKLSF